MCNVLQIPRSTYYYEAKEHENQEEELTKLKYSKITAIFMGNGRSK